MINRQHIIALSALAAIASTSATLSEDTHKRPASTQQECHIQAQPAWLTQQAATQPLVPAPFSVNPTRFSACTTHFVRIPEGTLLPLVLKSDVYTHALRPGDRVVAQLIRPIALPSGDILSPGTCFFGDISATNTDSMFGPAARLMQFDRMQLNDGTNFPIRATIIAQAKPVDFILIPANSDLHFCSGQEILLQLAAPAQIAVIGNAM
jgi:hypothetical protein